MQLRSGGDVEHATLPVVQQGQHYAMRVTAAVGLVAGLVARLRASTMQAQEAEVQQKPGRGNEGAVAAALEERISIVLALRRR